jgi:hypothetical protein
MKNAGGKLDQEDDLRAQMPRLGEFISEAAERLKISGYSAFLRIGSSIQELFDTKDKDRSQVTKLLHLSLRVTEAEARGEEAYVIKANTKQGQEEVDTQKINIPCRQLLN